MPISSLLRTLSPEQLKAVEASGHTLVSACPGSGKTRVLATKSCYHIMKERASVVAVTFTKDSAEEIKSRVQKMGVRNRKLFRAGTFHSLCLYQLHRSNILKGLTMIGGGEQIAIMKRVWSRFAEDIDFDDAKEAIESFKATLNPVLGDNPESDVFRAYQELIQREKRYDFADMILLTCRAMDEGNLEPIKADYMLVDESQDMDEVQYHWCKAHGRIGTKITLVGDDDQSIYGWRHAMGYPGMMKFVQEHKADHLTLSTNYRSDKLVLSHATSLIQHNKDRVDKSMSPASSLDGSVRFVIASSQVNEGIQVRDALLADMKKEWGILGRTNRGLDVIELHLAAAKIPYCRVGGKSFWDSVEPSVFLGLIKAVHTGEPRCLAQVLHWAGISDKIIAMLGRGATAEADLNKILTVLKKTGNVEPVQISTIEGLVKMYPQWRSLIERGRISLAIGGVGMWIASFASDKISKVVERCAEIISKLSGSIPQRIMFLQQSKKQPGDSNLVTLMTVHKSKGLEFDNVWVIGMEDGVMPHLESPADEERRLAFVAITRARHNLIMSYALEDKAIPSRFIAEAGLDISGAETTSS